MRPMSHTGLKPYYALLVFSSLCLSGCGWRPKISFPAPDGHHSFILFTYAGPLTACHSPYLLPDPQPSTSHTT